jgi:hypothetical protein
MFHSYEMELYSDTQTFSPLSVPVGSGKQTWETGKTPCKTARTLLVCIWAHYFHPKRRGG